MTHPTIDAAACAAVYERIQAESPRVHVITNSVAQALTANVLLAVGVRPTMTVSPEEIADFVSGAGALLVNLGTLDQHVRSAIEAAVELAGETAVPFVLDPVFIDISTLRREFAASLARREPAVIRGNTDEIKLLAGNGASRVDAARHLAVEMRTVVALTGGSDLTTDGHQVVRIENGHPMLRHITATGCAGAALTAACRAVEPDPMLAAAASLLTFGIAAEKAIEGAKGPGSVAVGLIDALASLSPKDFVAKGRIERLA